MDALIKYLNINRDEFLFQFQSHPNYPSALALGDTLNFLGVENSAYELEKDYWSEIPNDFITLYGQRFALVKKSSNSFADIYSDTRNFITTEELHNNSTDLVILLNNTDTAAVSKSKNNSWVVILILCAFVGASLLFNFSWGFISYNLLSLLGAFISYEIFKEKFGSSSPVLNTICGKVDSESNCNKVISSDKINIFGLKLSELSLVYFTALFFITTLIGMITPIMLLISVFASSIILYSLYVQIFVEKKFCKVCLLIIAVLICQLLLAYLSIDTYKFSHKEITICIFIVIAILIIVSTYNKLILENIDLRRSNIRNLKFKRNYELFKSQLLNSSYISFENSQSGFFVGNHNSAIHLTLISNPFCGFCKEAHYIAEHILEKYPQNISIQIRFNFTNQNDNNLKAVLFAFKNIYQAFGQKIFLQKVGEWFDKRDLQQLKKEKGTRDVDLTEEYKIGIENLELGLTFTPIFLINGYKFPQNYEREDLFYFIDDLLEDEDLIANKLTEAEKLTE